MSQLPEEVQAVVKAEQARKHTEAKDKAQNEVFNTVDKDKTFATIKVKPDGEAKLSAVQKVVWREVWRRVALGEEYSTDLTSDVVQEMRPLFQQMGVLDSGPPDQEDPYGGYSIGPAGEVPPTLQAAAPPERVPTGHPDRGKYLAAQMAWLAAHPEAE